MCICLQLPNATSVPHIKLLTHWIDLCLIHVYYSYHLVDTMQACKCSNPMELAPNNVQVVGYENPALQGEVITFTCLLGLELIAVDLSQQCA